MKTTTTLLLALLSFTIFAKEYHVDQNASANGDGSENSPFTTIKQAADLMVAGDVCFIHAGVYRETLAPKNSGTSANPIKYTAYQDDIVIINATNEVTGWQKHEGNIYKANNVTMSLEKKNNVYFDAKKMQLARWPNDSDDNEYTLDATYIKIDEGTWSRTFITNEEIPQIDWTGGVIHYLGAHSGCSWERTITGFNVRNYQLSFVEIPDKWPFTTNGPGRYENGHRGIFYLMNKLEALDAPQEWYYDKDTKELYLYAPEGVSPETGTVEIAARERTAELYKNYIEVDKLNFFGGMVTIKGSHNKMTNCMVKHGIEKLIYESERASDFDGALQIMSGNNNAIEKCVFENGTLNGIFVAGNATDNRVENCIIQNFNTIGLHVTPIRNTGKRNKYLRNSIYGSARDGAYISGEGNEFAYNHVQKCLITGADGGLFYVVGPQKDNEIHHNWFHDAHSAEHAVDKAAGIYLDNDAQGYTVHHNVVWDVEWGGLHMNFAKNNKIYNNTFWQVGDRDEAVIQCWVPVVNGERTSLENNTLYNNLADRDNWWDSGDGSNYRIDDEEWSGPDADNVFENNDYTTRPPFVDYEALNFMLREGSEFIDAGKEIAGITDDFTGTAPDLGAYEYGGDQWIPGVDWTPENFAWTPGNDYSSLNLLDVPLAIKLYPNPASDILNIVTLDQFDYQIVKTNGKVLMKGKMQQGQNSLSVSHLNKGMYIFQVQNEGKAKAYQILIK